MLTSTIDNTTAYGVIIGRFQTFKLRKEHINLIESVRAKHQTVVIVLTDGFTTRRNPLNFIFRKEMIREAFPGMDVIRISDTRYDTDWVENLEKALYEFPAGSVTLYSSNPSVYIRNGGRLPIIEFDLERVSSDSVENVAATEAFRAGIIYNAANQFYHVFPAVDVAVRKNDQYLLVRRRNEPLFRFPGGMVDATDKNIEDAGAREVMEEIKCLVTNMRYVGSFLVDDWRFRLEQDKIMTVLYTADYVSGEPTVSDDLTGGETRWFSISEIRLDMVVEEHRPLLASLIN